MHNLRPALRLSPVRALFPLAFSRLSDKSLQKFEMQYRNSSHGLSRGTQDSPISITINTLLGGAFLLEVDPLTRISQVKDMLSQMQGIPIK